MPDLPQPWDILDPSISFTLGAFTEENDASIDWNLLKEDLRPQSLDASAWEPVWEAFTQKVGPTWGDYIKKLQENAVYLSNQGISINDVRELANFELRQVNGNGLIDLLDSIEELESPQPGTDLMWQRLYPSRLSSRNTKGPLGYGWKHNWEYTLFLSTEGDVSILEPNGTLTSFPTR